MAPGRRKHLFPLVQGTTNISAEKFQASDPPRSLAEPAKASLFRGALTSVIAKPRVHRDSLSVAANYLSLSFSPLRETFASYRLETSYLLFTARSYGFQRRFKSYRKTRSDVPGRGTRYFSRGGAEEAPVQRSARGCRYAGATRRAAALREVSNLSGWTDKARAETRSLLRVESGSSPRDTLGAPKADVDASTGSPASTLAHHGDVTPCWRICHATLKVELARSNRRIKAGQKLVSRCQHH